tara:strand:+ start:769 stop:939 length:171 start_codon:yes stop_codon:yes gene_type:complete
MKKGIMYGGIAIGVILAGVIVKTLINAKNDKKGEANDPYLSYHKSKYHKMCGCQNA